MSEASVPISYASVAETFWVSCDDGWRLALHRFSPRRVSRRLPVLLVHGIAANRLHFDLDARYSLARCLRDAGYDTFIVELRGAGLSRPPQVQSRRNLGYGFSDYAERDLPTAITAITERTGAASLHGIGHSMGGMLLLCVAARAPHALSSLTTVGTPLVSRLGQALGPTERRLLQLASRLTPAAKLTPPSQRRIPLRRLLGAAGLMMPISSRLADNLLFNIANSEAYVLARLAKEGIHNIPVQLITEITDHMAQNTSPLGPYSYEEVMTHVLAPTLAFSGSVDRIAPPQSVIDLVSRLSCQDIRYRPMGLAHGDRTDYGHIDLLLGIHAPSEIYPQIVDFISEIDGS